MLIAHIKCTKVKWILSIFQCMVAYVEFEIMEGAYEISCPDALCPAQGILSLDEITKLSSSSLIDKHNRYRLNRGTFYGRILFSVQFVSLWDS